MSQTRRLAAIPCGRCHRVLAAMEADEEGTLAQIRSIRTDLVDPTIAADFLSLYRAMVDHTAAASAVDLPIAYAFKRGRIRISRMRKTRHDKQSAEFRPRRGWPGRARP